MQPLIDMPLWLAHKRRALARPVGGADFLMRRAAEDLADRLDAVERKFAKAAALFCQTPAAADVLAESGKVTEIVRVEADPAFLEAEPAFRAGRQGLVAPPETVPFEPESLDLVVSLLSLQATNDIPGMLVQIRRSLRPDGLFLGALAGAGTLSELRESLLAAETELYGGASPRVIPFTDVRDAGALLQRAGLALPVADVETVTVRYDTLFDLVADLRAMGETSALADRSRRPGTRRLFARAAEIYAERFSDADGRVRASFSIVWMSGWAPDASQQKPLKPGSAKVSLKTILENPDRR
ncbi:methyltransferase domain-containing protein [Mesorhizobium sp. LjNodule214]|uniref:methyltransferase domain-containing protein n=1 Tax=Mesorhizobium sp. LjNodule214 TaxID=3342252 RepID=UPI003ECCDF2B